jgi:predicted TIM-barrel fold metal-dependent hydrolase
LEVFGPERVLFGSDEPYWSIASGVSTVEAAGIDPVAESALWHGNAEKVFGLPGAKIAPSRCATEEGR